MKFGVDTGGTFTDVVSRDTAGRLRVHKLLSTPHDPSEAIANGVVALCATPADVVHGTTVATNALLERKGDRVVFATTAGFEDLLVLRRQNRPQLYARHPMLPEPLTRLTVGVQERVLADGTILSALTNEELDSVVARVMDLQPAAVAICLLHSYANDQHELQLAAALREALPGVHVTASSEIVREFREYERACTTVVNAYVGPTMSRYIARLGARLQGEVDVLLSSGGRATLEEAARAPVHTVLSGPAGGVLGAFAAAADLGLKRCITFDMGGTSTDVSLCDGAPAIAYDATIADLPLKIPSLDILTVGAGGGSIGWLDPGGALRVGPHSAGSVPGPAAYARGGSEPTVTDAHVVLGSLRPESFLGGDMSLDAEAAHVAVATLAERAGLSVEETARGMLDIADAAMARTVKVACSRQGKDPRDFALVAFGGAGGLHACRLADALGITRVAIPANPGLLSAYGMLQAPRTRLYSEGVVAPLDDDVLASTQAVLRARAGEVDDLRFTAALRYRGQAHELEVEVTGDAGLAARAFAERHSELFGYSLDMTVELVTVRLTAVVGAPPFVDAPDAPQAGNPPRRASIDLGQGAADTLVVDRVALDAHDGPMVVTEYSGTTLIPAGWRVESSDRHLVLRRL